MLLQVPNSSIQQETIDLLLFFSRQAIPAEQTDLARSLSKSVLDWNVLTAIAAQKFGLPFIHHNLKSLLVGPQHNQILQNMETITLNMILHNLRVHSELRSFHQTLVAPNFPEHVYLKGPVLAHQCFDQPSLRFARDIDILVSRNDQRALIMRAIKKGYVVKARNDVEEAEIDDSQLEALLRYQTVVSLVSPGGMLIEVHRSVDKDLGVFDTQTLIASAEPVQLPGFAANSLPIAELFCYICYHNTRHTWSRLHWMADLDAVVGHVDFDESHVMAVAEKNHLRPLVSACLDFHKAATSAPEIRSAALSISARELFEACVRNFSGDLQLEYELRKSTGMLDLPFHWMVRPELHRRAQRRAKMSRFLPDFDDYAEWPLPKHLHWLYYLWKPARSFGRSLQPNTNPSEY